MSGREGCEGRRQCRAGAAWEEAESSSGPSGGESTARTGGSQGRGGGWVGSKPEAGSAASCWGGSPRCFSPSAPRGRCRPLQMWQGGRPRCARCSGAVGSRRPHHRRVPAASDAFRRRLLRLPVAETGSFSEASFLLPQPGKRAPSPPCPQPVQEGGISALTRPSSEPSLRSVAGCAQSAGKVLCRGKPLTRFSARQPVGSQVNKFSTT